ncbi:Tetratricopeptide repeat like superfamily protein [Quillaja saponaria]|uniref:Tetratricopeptide repeat like superfamily protein n=1 Tax=Quillaja saponaria TaxID=32244 RepID=A0AAD7PSI2_QUISA|nr:Tetratricopeptide repeat like superfamily protein [Quillaja saponaria]
MENLFSDTDSRMVYDILLQIGLFLLVVFMFLAMHDIPQKFFAKLRIRNRGSAQAKRHFVLGAQLLAQARAAKTRSSTNSLADKALVEAEKAITLDPKDAAAYLLKALVLDLQGFRTSALDSLDMAFSPLAVKSLSETEKGDALFKRAELKMAIDKQIRVDSALADLTDAVKLSTDNAKAFCLLGECYEVKKMREEAMKAYEEALRVEPQLAAAQEALNSESAFWNWLRHSTL